MPSVVAITGSLVDFPGDGSLGPVVPWPIDVRVQLSWSAKIPVTLSSDSPFSVPLGGKTPGVIRLEANSPVTVALTSAAGSAQAITCDEVILASRTKPYTAVTLTRSPGVLTEVVLFMGTV